MFEECIWDWLKDWNEFRSSCLLLFVKLGGVFGFLLKIKNDKERE